MLPSVTSHCQHIPQDRDTQIPHQSQGTKPCMQATSQFVVTQCIMHYTCNTRCCIFYTTQCCTACASMRSVTAKPRVPAKPSYALQANPWFGLEAQLCWDTSCETASIQFCQCNKLHTSGFLRSTCTLPAALATASSTAAATMAMACSLLIGPDC